MKWTEMNKTSKVIYGSERRTMLVITITWFRIKTVIHFVFLSLLKHPHQVGMGVGQKQQRTSTSNFKLRDDRSRGVAAWWLRQVRAWCDDSDRSQGVAWWGRVLYMVELQHQWRKQLIHIPCLQTLYKTKHGDMFRNVHYSSGPSIQQKIVDGDIRSSNWAKNQPTVHFHFFQEDFDWVKFKRFWGFCTHTDWPTVAASSGRWRRWSWGRVVGGREWSGTWSSRSDLWAGTSQTLKDNQHVSQKHLASSHEPYKPGFRASSHSSDLSDLSDLSPPESCPTQQLSTDSLMTSAVKNITTIDLNKNGCCISTLATV